MEFFFLDDSASGHHKWLKPKWALWLFLGEMSTLAFYKVYCIIFKAYIDFNRDTAIYKNTMTTWQFGKSSIGCYKEEKAVPLLSDMEESLVLAGSYIQNGSKKKNQSHFLGLYQNIFLLQNIDPEIKMNI